MATDLQNSLFDTMKQFMQHSQTTYKGTTLIECTILECTNVNTGEYKANYLGNQILVYSTNKAKYSKDDIVYVIVPEGDFSKTKTIIGFVTPKQEGTIINISNETIRYYNITDNLFTDLGEIQLSSYKEKTEETIEGQAEGKDKLIFNSANFAEIIKAYLENYRTFDLSFNARTELELERQRDGNYGIVLNIPVIKRESDGSTKAETKQVYLDTTNMFGNPYHLGSWSPQHVYFTLENQYDYDSSKLPSLTYFCKDFVPPIPEKEQDYDIFLKNISLTIVEELSEEDTNGFKLTLSATQGHYFASNYRENKVLTPTLRINGVITDIEGYPTYWFVQDASVKQNSEYYSQYGGYAWKCLNKKTEDKYDTNLPTYTVNKKDFGEVTTYKCVVIYDGAQCSATIELIKLDNTEVFEINHHNGTGIYVRGKGNVTLDAKTEYESESADGEFVYSVLRYDRLGRVIQDTNDFFNIDSHTTKDYNSSTQIYTYKNTAEISYPVSQVEDFNTIVCSVSFKTGDKSYLIGTKTLVATVVEESGDPQDVNIYLLNLIGGNKLYKYDSDGDAPNSAAYDGDLESRIDAIEPISYTLKYSDGTEFSADEYRRVKYKWCVPKDSLFEIIGEVEPSSEDDEYFYYTGIGKNSLAYDLASRYDAAAALKQIKLEVEFFEGSNFREAIVPILFTKDGMIGTNGTSITAVLVSGGDTEMTSIPYGTKDSQGLDKKLKLLYNTNSNKFYTYNYSGKNWSEFTTTDDKIYSNMKIYPRVYKNGELMDMSEYSVEYSIFDEIYSDAIVGVYNDNTEIGIRLLAKSGVELNNETCCVVVQARVTITTDDGASQDVYTYYPVETIIADNVINDIKAEGGFFEVEYNADGTEPKWDSSKPFSFNGVSSVTWSASANIEYEVDEKNPGLLDAEPILVFENLISKNYVSANIGGVKYIRPIVFHYNRYSMNNLNAWDGNKIKVDDGYLLAPQVGAGKKEDDNSFTGVVMGLKSMNDGGSPEAGLYGYSSGTQTFKLDAEDGSAVFGASGGGQFIIDATSTEIKYANENFIVNKEGHLTAKGGGSIAGWEIGDYTLTGTAEVGEDETWITLNSAVPAIYANVDLDDENLDTSDGFYLDPKLFQMGDTFKLRITDDKSYLMLGDIYSEDNDYWTIDFNDNASYISYGTTFFKNPEATDSVYIGTDGISLGGDKFWVDSEGNAGLVNMTAEESIKLLGDDYEGSFKIGEFTFSSIDYEETKHGALDSPIPKELPDEVGYGVTLDGKNKEEEIEGLSDDDEEEKKPIIGDYHNVGSLSATGVITSKEVINSEGLLIGKELQAETAKIGKMVTYSLAEKAYVGEGAHEGHDGIRKRIYPMNEFWENHKKLSELYPDKEWADEDHNPWDEGTDEGDEVSGLDGCSVPSIAWMKKYITKNSSEASVDAANIKSVDELPEDPKKNTLYLVKNVKSYLDSSIEVVNEVPTDPDEETIYLVRNKEAIDTDPKDIRELTNSEIDEILNNTFKS